MLLLRIWPLVVAAELVVVTFAGRAILDPDIEHLHDVMAITAALACLFTAMRPHRHLPRVVSVALAAGVFFGRGLWIVGWSTFGPDARLVGGTTYVALAFAVWIVGMGSTLVAAGGARGPA